jgi:hypothetical protein
MALLSKADHEEKRSPEWPAYRDAYLKANPKCSVCSATTDLQVHHIYPVSYIYEVGREDLELNFKNYMTLCESERGANGENHHLLVGHLDSFKSRNINVRDDSRKFRNRPHKKADIEGDADWKKEKATRPKPASDMTNAEKDALKAELVHLFGPKPQKSQLE